MKINNNIIKYAIKKTNDRWDKLHNSYQRNQIKYDDCLDLFQTYIEKCNTPIIGLE